MTVSSDGCTEFRGGAFVALSFNDVDQHIGVDSAGAWSATVTIPSGAEIGEVFTINALCANVSTTVFRYADAAFTVVAPTPTSAATTTSTFLVVDPLPLPTTATTPTTVLSPPLGGVDLVDPTTVTTVGPAAQLPRTGANDATGLTALAVSFHGAGGLLLSRRRVRRP